jgi:hypothetical protein
VQEEDQVLLQQPPQVAEHLPSEMREIGRANV